MRFGASAAVRGAALDRGGIRGARHRARRFRRGAGREFNRGIGDADARPVDRHAAGDHRRDAAADSPCADVARGRRRGDTRDLFPSAVARPMPQLSGGQLSALPAGGGRLQRAGGASARRASPTPLRSPRARRRRRMGSAWLRDNIQDSAQNTTRFLVIGSDPAGRSGADKTTAAVRGAATRSARSTRRSTSSPATGSTFRKSNRARSARARGNICFSST